MRYTLTFPILSHQAVNHFGFYYIQAHCSLMLDGMSIQQFIEFDHNKETNIGFVDMGSGQQDGEQEVAKEVLVVMAVCLHQHWKIPLGMGL